MKKVAQLAAAASAWATLGVASVFAQSTTTLGTTTTTTPGVPNTGAGGDAMINILLLGVAAVVMVAGIVYLARVRKAE